MKYLVLTLILGLPGILSAQDAETPGPAVVQSVEPAATSESSEVSFTLAPHVGVLVPQLFSELGSWPIFGLEFGYILPFDVGSMERPLAITLDGMYSQPGSSGSAFEPTLGEEGQNFDWELTQRMVVVELAAQWRFMPAAQGLSVYGLIGPRLYLLESVVTASSEGSDFGENAETQTHVGMVAGGGVEYPLGPGSLFGALEFGWSDLNTRVTGDSNTGTLVVDLGYRFMF